VYGKLTWRKEVIVVGYFGLNLLDIEAKGVEILALMGMKTQRRRSVLANCEGQRSGLE
jgi:hypothetical protein